MKRRRDDEQKKKKKTKKKNKKKKQKKNKKKTKKKNDKNKRHTLQKHAYSNILEIVQPKKENFQIKNSNVLHISSQSIDCGYSLEPHRRGSSNEYPQSMFFLAK